MLRSVISLCYKKLQKNIEERKISKDKDQKILKDIIKVRDKIFNLYQKFEKENSKGIMKSNIYNSLVLLDDLIENMEIYFDDEIQGLSQKIASAL